ncbi:MAG TPA: hypothetical protein VH228_19320 [Nocardioides sp.]|nr:hypothetical protein [Nocardioides sp.]
MRGRPAFFAISLAAAGLVSIAPASAQPIDKGHFHDVETSSFDCDGTPVQQTDEVDVNFLFNQRGGSKHPFPYYRESVRETVTWTNLDNGGTFTLVQTANRKDHKIVDNGDGTITIYQYAAGGARYYDNAGTLVLKDPGNVRFAFDIDYNGTPGNPDDDQEIDGSFRTVRESTGRNDTVGRDFCADVVEFSSR